MAPTIFEFYPEYLNPTFDLNKEEPMFKVITRRIDAVEPLQAIMTAAFGVSAKLLAEIKGKTFADIKQDKQPILYSKLKMRLKRIVICQFIDR